MIPWIQVYSNLPSHPKVSRLADELNLSSAVVSPDIIATGILISLWTWAIQNAYSGDLSGCSARTIAEACRWRKKPETLLNALLAAGWLDPDKKLHDWEEYAVLLIDQEDNKRQKTKERVRKFRERKKAEETPQICQYCGEPATSIDHIIPKARGGTDSKENIVPSCMFCNSAKQDRPLIDFLNSHLDRVRPEIVTSNANLAKFVRYDVTKKNFVIVTSNANNAPTIPNHTIPITSTIPTPKPIPSTRDNLAAVEEQKNGLGEVMTLYLSRINAMPSTAAIDLLKGYTEELSADVVLHALNIALDEKKTSWSYIQGILQRYSRDGLTSLKKVLAAEQEFEASKDKRTPYRGKKAPPPPEKPEGAKIEELEMLRAMRQKMKEGMG